MLYYMFGMDAKVPAECAKMLKKRGFGAVVSPPTDEAAQAVRDAGMQVWGCVGAFSMREGDPDEYLAEDAFGSRRKWFGSGCPNERALWERGFGQIEIWKKRGAARVLGDGARFASPCPGTELFLSCFCPRCMQKGKELGFDMEKMRADVRAWSQTPGMNIPQEWLRFREECVREYFDEFSARIHAAGMESGSFIFADSLAGIVGQTPEATKSLDVVAPMLYRKYVPRPGIACLNDEYASLFAFYKQRGDENAADVIFAENGVRVPAENAQEIHDIGFAPQAVGDETSRAAKRNDALVAPILQLDDEELGKSIASAKENGAQEIGFFAYSEQGLAYLPEKL